MDGSNKKISIDENLRARVSGVVMRYYAQDLLYTFADKNRFRSTEMFGLFETGPQIGKLSVSGCHGNSQMGESGC